MDDKVIFMGEPVQIIGKDQSEILYNAFPQMVSIAAKRLVSDFTPEGSVNTSVPTFREVAEPWFEYYHKPKVGMATARNSRILLDKHIYPRFADVPVDKITKDDIQALLVADPKKGYPTVQNMKILINIVLNKALEDGYIQRNPADTKFTIPGKKGRRNALSKEDAQDIINHMGEVNLNDRIFIVIPLFAGLRRGEVLGLQWTDLDFDKKLIRVQRSVTFYNNRPIVGTTKTAAGVRIVPMLDRVEEFLIEYHRVNTHDGFLISRDDGISPITESMYMFAWERISETIDLHGATAHVFRHTYATMAEPYLDPKTLQYIMGHNDIQTTMNTYAHSRDDMVMEAGGNIKEMYE